MYSTASWQKLSSYQHTDNINGLACSHKKHYYLVDKK